MKRALADGLELDDDPLRVDVDAVHAFLSQESYWAQGRARDVVERLVRTATRIVGLYDGDRQIGFARTISDGLAFGYLADVYILPDHRGRGLGKELVRFAVDESPLKPTKWLLHTQDAHELYASLGFTAPSDRVMERRSP